MKTQSYKLSFDIGALTLFVVIMLPNLIWFAMPAPDDILRGESSTPHIDVVSAVFQILMIGILCFVKNKHTCSNGVSTTIIVSVIFCIFYYVSWILYYLSIIHIANIISLTITPCLAFMFFAIARKNYIATIPIFVFSICHLTHAVVNFAL